jgi:hypothetical protein
MHNESNVTAGCYMCVLCRHLRLSRVEMSALKPERALVLLLLSL